MDVHPGFRTMIMIPQITYREVWSLAASIPPSQVHVLEENSQDVVKVHEDIYIRREQWQANPGILGISPTAHWLCAGEEDPIHVALDLHEYCLHYRHDMHARQDDHFLK